jgi:exodeoxyribonuclease VII large subunit
MAVAKGELDAGTEAMVNTFRTQLAMRRAHTERLAAQLEALSPIRILERGYALVFDANGALIKDAAQLVPGTEVSARVARGTFTAEVKSTKRD